MGIGERYKNTVAEVADTCRAAGRDPNEVTLVAVSKTVGEDGVEAALAAGAHDFGENRPDPLKQKSTAFPEAHWHFIGNIQSRRIREIVACATLIHSVVHEEHAKKIASCACEAGKVQDILIEVNVSGEASKSGIAPHEALELVRRWAAFDGLRIRGFMTMAPQGDLIVARQCFKTLAELRRQVQEQWEAPEAAAFDQLSMGMSDDWREAIAEGATLVRIGRAIFSDSYE